jgi:SPP1 family predicted phage head-tail adaptor
MVALTAAGDLREEIEVQNYVETDDGYGGVIQEWQTAFTAPARIRTLRGGETIIAARLAGTQTLVATLRYQPAVDDVTPAWRAKNLRSGTMYNIRSVTIDERKAFADLLMESGVS